MINFVDRLKSIMKRFCPGKEQNWRNSASGFGETENGYVPVMGAGEHVYSSITPVTNEEYPLFIQATGYDVPENWINGSYPDGQGNYPVVFVSCKDADWNVM